MSEFEVAKQNFEDIMGNLFDDENIEQVFAEFEKTAQNGEVSQEEFKRIFALLFDDEEDENAFVLLDNKLLLDRIFVYCDRDGNGSIDLAEFCDGISLMFSGEPENTVKFRYTVFDIDNSGSVTRDNVLVVLTAALNTAINALGIDPDIEGAVVEKAKGIAQAESGELLQEAVDAIFSATALNEQGNISYEAFQAAYEEDDSIFDWNEIAGDVLETIEERLGNTGN
eukprot:TRINITY_DN7123_c0_g1_i1.p1 TRINITY_DN7123_c0_g1~~TRINITY_DN7123_c0_g1_i1.p1  ORF type:complete len:234 (+),score=63.78 TRINITY_DN7123_c0_g1_i1:27-704(+)